MDKVLSGIREEAGLSLVELLVGLVITLVFATMLTLTYSHMMELSVDNQIKTATEEKARSVLDIMVFDIRLTGSGVPFMQEGFLPGGSGLGDAPLPVLLDSDGDTYHFRMNETGKVTVLIADFSPTESSRTFSVESVEDFDVGDDVYISDAVVGGNDGLKGEIDSISGLNVTIKSDYKTSSAPTFPSGSLVQRVMTVTYDSPSDWSGVTRDNEETTVTLAPNTTFSIDYLDQSSSSLSLPLSENDVVKNLTSVKITVNARSDRKLSDGSTYTFQAEQVVALRNLYINH